MTDLISRAAAIAALREASARPSSISEIEALPAITPIVVINVTGGIADVVAATHKVEVETLDYDITANEQDDYIVDENGDQAWLYGEVATVDPEKVKKILDYPTVEEARNENGWTNEPDDGHRHVWTDAEGIDTRTDARALQCVKCGTVTAE